jgi:hypothetical protein
LAPQRIHDLQFQLAQFGCGRDADGQLWNVTLAPAPRTSRAGLSEGTLAVGDEVTLTGMRNDDDGSFEIKTRRVQRGDEIFDVYPPE